MQQNLCIVVAKPQNGCSNTSINMSQIAAGHSKKF
jgi:hypothetical protein